MTDRHQLRVSKVKSLHHHVFNNSSDIEIPREIAVRMQREWVQLERDKEGFQQQVKASVTHELVNLE